MSVDKVFVSSLERVAKHMREFYLGLQVDADLVEHAARTITALEEELAIANGKDFTYHVEKLKGEVAVLKSKLAKRDAQLAALRLERK